MSKRLKSKPRPEPQHPEPTEDELDILVSRIFAVVVPLDDLTGELILAHAYFEYCCRVAKEHKETRPDVIFDHIRRSFLGFIAENQQMFNQLTRTSH